MNTLPPGSRLPRALQTLRYLADPAGTLRRAHRRHGPVFRIDFLGFPTEVFVTTPELAAQVYDLDDGGGRAGEIRRTLLEPVVGTASLLTLDGPRWRRHRKLLTPPLHGRTLAAHRDTIAAITAADIARWPLHTPFALRDRTQAITLEVILRVVFGVSDETVLTRLRTLLPALIDADTALMALTVLPALRRSRLARHLPLLGIGRLTRAREELDTLLYALIAERRAAPAPGATDVLSLLLTARDTAGEGLTDTEIRDELVTMAAAGHETTATAIAWAFERILREPGVLSRLRDEITAGEEDTYLEAVTKETLRARPIIYDVPRLLDAPLDLGGHRAPAGWSATPLILQIHHDPAVYPDPGRFRPERFLGPGAAAANRSWMPFGGGRRYCVGAQFALLEMRVVIAEILRRADLAAVRPAAERPRIRNVTFTPSKGTLVRLTARHDPAPHPASRPA